MVYALDRRVACPTGCPYLLRSYGMTPKQAAADPEMRPMLIELMKDHLNELEKMRKDRDITISIDWVLDELGLEELK